MPSAIAYSLPLALGVLLSSLPLTLIPVMLLTRRDTRSMATFLLGWVTGFLLVGSVTLLLADVIAPSPNGPPAWANWARALLGALLLRLAWKQWRLRPQDGATPTPPAWMRKIDALTPRRAAGFGILLSSVNPKNAALIATGTLTIASATSVPSLQIGALIVFAAVSSLGLFTPVLLSKLLGERAIAPLEKFKAWMVQNNATVMMVVLAALGIAVLSKGLQGLIA
jgi:hypothetical protein